MSPSYCTMCHLKIPYLKKEGFISLDRVIIFLPIHTYSRPDRSEISLPYTSCTFIHLISIHRSLLKSTIKHLHFSSQMYSSPQGCTAKNISRVFVHYISVTDQFCLVSSIHTGACLQYIPVRVFNTCRCVSSYRCVSSIRTGACLQYVPVRVFNTYRCVSSIRTGACLQYVPVRVFNAYRCVSSMRTGACLRCVPVRVFDAYRCVSSMHTGVCLRCIPVCVFDAYRCVSSMHAGVCLRCMPVRGRY